MKINNLKEEIKVPQGIWTPNAKVLCYECHGDRFSKVKYNPETNRFEDVVLNEEDFKNATLPQSLEEEYNAVTKCNHCKKDIQVRKSIAYENSLVDILKESDIEACMAQTGGMNSAVEIPTKDNGYALITYDSLGENEWYLGFYDEEGVFLDKEYTSCNREEFLKYVFELKEKKYNIVIQGTER